MILWHRTSAAVAECVFRDGFRDDRGTYLTDQEFSGVWLSDQPLDANEGASGDTLLCVDLAAVVSAVGLRVAHRAAQQGVASVPAE
jgi:hypothetical protein